MNAFKSTCGSNGAEGSISGFLASLTSVFSAGFSVTTGCGTLTGAAATSAAGA